MKTLKLTRQYGRLGNQLLCLVEAIYCCECIRLDIIDFSCAKSYASFFKTQVLNIQQRTIVTNRNYGNLTKRTETYFESNMIGFYTQKCPLRERKRIIQQYILPIFSIPETIELDELDLVIHCRGGDIFNRSHKAYTQPPLDFYTNIIQSKQWKNIYLVCEENKNPLVRGILETHKNVSFIADTKYSINRGRHNSNGFKEDLTFLLSAKNLVVCNSSLSPFIVCGSSQLQNVYMPSFYVLGLTLNPRHEPAIWWNHFDDQKTTCERCKHTDTVLHFLNISMHLYDYYTYTNAKELWNYNNENTLKRLLEYKRETPPEAQETLQN